MTPEPKHRPRILITHRVHREVVERLAERYQVVTNDTDFSLSRTDLLRAAEDAEALMTFMPDRVDDELLACCPKLRVIAAALKGYDNIDVQACSRHGVWVTVVEDLLTDPTAELAVGLLLGLSRHITSGDRRVREGLFTGWQPLQYGLGLAGTQVALVGFGRLGRAVAHRLAAFGPELVYFDPIRAPKQVETRLRVAFLSLREALATSRVVVVCAPLLSETLHLIGQSAISSMPAGSLIVNVGRGSVVDEAAVAEALQAGRLAGYAADVFEFEDLTRPDRPPGIHPGLLACPDRTLFTPHLGSAVSEVRLAIEHRCAGAILQALSGAIPDGTPNRLMHPAPGSAASSPQNPN